MLKGLSARVLLTMLVMAAGIVPLTERTFAESNKVEKAASAKVSIDEAITTARESVSGTVIEAELEQKHDKLIWEVEVVTTEQKIMEVHIDAETRAVIDVKEEKTKPKRFLKRN